MTPHLTHWILVDLALLSLAVGQMVIVAYLALDYMHRLQFREEAERRFGVLRGDRDAR